MTAISTAACIIVALLCWAWIRVKDNEATAADNVWQHKVRERELLLTKELAQLGYVQVPVIQETTLRERHDDLNLDDDELDADTTIGFLERRQWQLAWVPKDTVGQLLSVLDPDSDNDNQLLEDALRPT